MPARKDDKYAVTGPFDKLRHNAIKAAQAKARFECQQCFGRSVGRSDACRALGMCEECFGSCKRQQCCFCEIDFLEMDWMKPKHGHLVGARAACVDCISARQFYGDPKRCDTCNRQSAFQGISCTHCTAGREKYGEPETCEMCHTQCAFRVPQADDLEDDDLEEKYGGMTLCVVCKRIHAFEGRRASKADGSKGPKVAPTKEERREVHKKRVVAQEEDRMNYRRWCEMTETLRRKQKELKEAEIKSERICKLHREKGGDGNREIRKNHMKKILGTKISKRDALLSKIAEAEVLAMQREKRFLLDVEGEDVRHRTEIKELEIKHHQFVQNTDLLTHENALINQMIIQDGRYPKSGKYPWQMNEEELTQMGIEEAIKASEMQVIQPDDFSPGKPQTYEEAREIFKNTTTPFVNTDKLKEIRADETLMDDSAFLKAMEAIDADEDEFQDAESDAEMDGKSPREPRTLSSGRFIGA